MDKPRSGRLLVISTGSQAEPRASLTRMALGDHHMITVEPSDTVVISARQIPGNERGIQNMINNLAKRRRDVDDGLGRTDSLHWTRQG